MHQFFDTPHKRRLAYNLSTGRGPGIVFLGGFMSDKEGTKATHLEKWAQNTGRSFLRFDYSGHGASSGQFSDGCISDWAADAVDIISAQTTGPQILVGSSMGAWIALLIARDDPKRVAGLVTVAGAPDFTEDRVWASLDADQKARIQAQGHLLLPSRYSDDPYRYTLKLIEDGRQNLVLRDKLDLPMPTRLLHGTNDKDVDQSFSIRLSQHATGDDIKLTLVDGADHRFSSPDCLSLIQQSIDDVSLAAA